jgi:hypothetical protein
MTSPHSTSAISPLTFREDDVDLRQITLAVLEVADSDLRDKVEMD